MERRKAPEPTGLTRKAKPASGLRRKAPAPSGLTRKPKKQNHTKFVWCVKVGHWQHVDVCKDKCKSADRCKILRKYSYSTREVVE